jgi:catalase
MKTQDASKGEEEKGNLTTDQGVKVNHTDDSLKAGERGSLLMEDFHFREKMTHFDHERIPERIVHARGSAAHGFFQVFDDSMKEFTKARFLTDPSLKTPVFTRFSTVVGFRGSADTIRDVRGFATKFYTTEGNYDLVGNNMPVFFIQDAIKFPDLVHAIKPEPHHEMPQASAAHDTFWDFISLMPESMHMIMWVLSDRALPKSYSTMEGFGVHTFRLINEQGESSFVKFHWKPKAGVHSLMFDEAQMISGKNPDFNREDLWESIEMGNYPEFDLGVQIIKETEEFDFEFDVLDATKLWPEELIPVKKVGRLVLDRNPDNFFAETEQVAFHPGNLVPGIDVSNDPLLQGRLFSYLDTQLIRLGGPNFAEIPINRPHVEVKNNQRDGYMRQTVNKGRVTYTPNSLANGQPSVTTEEQGGYVHYPQRVEGHKIRERSESFKDHFSQATLFWNSMSAPEKKHIIEGFHFELGKVETVAIRERMLGLLEKVDKELAREVSKGIGIEYPTTKVMTKADNVVEGLVDKVVEPKRKKHVNKAPSLSMENLKGDSLKGRRVAVLLSDGFDGLQLKEIKSSLNDAGVTVKIVSKHLGEVKSNQGEKITVDKSFVTTGSVLFDAVIVPDSKDSANMLKESAYAINFIQEMFKHCKPIGAIGESVELLLKTSIKDLDLSNNDSIKEKMGVLSIRTLNDPGAFNKKFIEAMKQYRFWDRETITEKAPA